MFQQECNEVIAILSGDQRNARVLCGGTDLLIQVREGRCNAESLVDMKNPELVSTKAQRESRLSLGAGASGHTISSDIVTVALHPDFLDAVKLIGSVQIQHQANIRGNF